MSNDFSSVVRQHYEESVEEGLKKELTAMDLAQLVDLPDGTSKQIPYVKARATSNYTKYTDQTIQDIKSGNDKIELTNTPMVTFAMDELDEDDNYIDVKPEVISDSVYQIKRMIDGAFFSEVKNAKWKYDANGFGLNIGTLSPVTLVTGANQNISTTYGMARGGLIQAGANGSKLALCVDNFQITNLTTLWLSVPGDTVADASFSRGFTGDFGGMRTYGVSTLYSSTVLDLATNPTAGDFFVVGGVKFTYVATLGTTPGNILIGASASNTVTNTVNAVNGGSGAGSTYVEIDGDDRARLEGITAVDGATIITFNSINGAIGALSSMTNANNDFQVQTTLNTIMERKTIKMVLRWVRTKMRGESKKLVNNWFIYARYGFKTTTRAKEKMVVIPVVSAPAEL